MAAAFSQRRQSGFTTIEIIVSVVVFSLTIVSIVSAVQYIQYAQRDSFYVDTANRAARQQIELLRNGDFGLLTSGTSINFTSALTDMPSGTTGLVNITTPTAAPSTRQVEVVIDYPIGANRKQVVIMAYVDPKDAS